MDVNVTQVSSIVMKVGEYSEESCNQCLSEGTLIVTMQGKLLQMNLYTAYI